MGIDSRRLIVATPAFGGLVSTGFAGSLFSSLLARHKFQLLFLDNESLIPRARNKLLHCALELGATHLLFIDADLSWTPEQLSFLLENDEVAVGGTYPVKQYPLRLNFNAHPSAAQKGHLLRVRHIPTGFLLISLNFVRKWHSSRPSFRATHPLTQQTVEMRDWFPSGPTPDGEYESEDWGFSRLVDELGEKLWLDSRCILPHTGTHTFKLEAT